MTNLINRSLRAGVAAIALSADDRTRRKIVWDLGTN